MVCQECYNWREECHAGWPRAGVDGSFQEKFFNNFLRFTSMNIADNNEG